MAELNRITEAIDQGLSSLRYGRRAGDGANRSKFLRLVDELEQASSRPAQLNTQAFSVDDIMHATDLFFDMLMSETNSSAALIELLGFLQRPISLSVKASPSFFVDPTHYARRLIKAIFVRENEIQDRADYKLDPVYQGLYNAIKMVVREYNGDDRIFLKAYYEILNI